MLIAHNCLPTRSVVVMLSLRVRRPR